VLRFVAFLIVAIGLGTWFRRRRLRQTTLPPSPADELRTRLAAADERVERLEPEPQTETPAAPAPPDGRRDDVHDRARRAIDELS